MRINEPKVYNKIRRQAAPPVRAIHIPFGKFLTLLEEVEKFGLHSEFSNLPTDPYMPASDLMHHTIYMGRIPVTALDFYGRPVWFFRFIKSNYLQYLHNLRRRGFVGTLIFNKKEFYLLELEIENSIIKCPLQKDSNQNPFYQYTKHIICKRGQE